MAEGLPLHSAAPAWRPWLPRGGGLRTGCQTPHAGAVACWRKGLQQLGQVLQQLLLLPFCLICSRVALPGEVNAPSCAQARQPPPPALLAPHPALGLPEASLQAQLRRCAEQEAAGDSAGAGAHWRWAGGAGAPLRCVRPPLLPLLQRRPRSCPTCPLHVMPLLLRQMLRQLLPLEAQRSCHPCQR